MPRKRCSAPSPITTVVHVEKDNTGLEDETVRATDEVIADFFEARPYFYDQGNSDYKNKQKRNSEMAEIAKTVGRGFTADSIWKRFMSIRTDIGKLKKTTKTGKSGQAPKPLTDLQQWKLKRFAFLDACIKNRSLGEEIGKGTSNEVDSENDDSCDDVPPAWPEDVDDAKQAMKPSGCKEKTCKKPKITSGVVQVLEKMLDESNKEMRAADRRVERLCQERQNQPVDERVAWGQWLTNACLAMPMVSFRAFQRETFDASMRYLPVVAPVPTPPVISFPAATGQSMQYSAQYAPKPTVQRDQPQSYLPLLQDQRPASNQSYTITNIETGSMRNSQIPSTTGVWNPSTSSSSVIAQAFQNVNASGVTNSSEIPSDHLPDDQ